MIESFNITLFVNDHMVHTAPINETVNIFNIVHNAHRVCKL